VFLYCPNGHTVSLLHTARHPFWIETSQPPFTNTYEFNSARSLVIFNVRGPSPTCKSIYAVAATRHHQLCIDASFEEYK
jgi:hypothetical protein